MATEARLALEEATRRVTAIAVVHEMLSQSFDESVDFDEIADRLRAMVVEVSSSAAAAAAAGSGGRVTSQRSGLVRHPARRPRHVVVRWSWSS